MRLDHLHLQNFRCYAEAHFDFNPGFNLLVGINGSGKTSLLKAIACAFTSFGNGLRAGAQGPDKHDMRFVIDKIDGKLRFERKFPLVLKASGALADLTEWKTLLTSDQVPPLDDLSVNLQVDELIQKISNGETITLPLLAFYQANRRLSGSHVSSESAAREQLSRFDGYLNWFDAVADMRGFESWVISKTLERMQSVIEGGASTGHDELAWVNEAIAIALPEASNLTYHLSLKSILVDIQGRTLLFNELSDGQRGLITLIADIARRMCVLNPHLGSDVFEKTNGVVIIDELDVHLHPAWQRRVAPALKQAFPNVQFVAASHSPQVIGSLTPGEIILLNDGAAAHPRTTYGLDSSSVLAEVMGVEQRDPAIEEGLSQLFTWLEGNDLAQARLQLDALKHKAPDLPEYARAEALITRKEAIGR